MMTIIDNISFQKTKKQDTNNQICIVVLSRLNDEYKKPKDEQNRSVVITWSTFINEFYDLQSSPEKLRSAYPESSENFEKFILDNHEAYKRIIPSEEKIQRQTPQRMVSKQMKNIAVAILMIFGIIFATQIVVYALGYDLLQIISEWTESILNAPYDTEITNDNTTVVKSKEKSYANIEHAVEKLGIGLLYPMYLPDGNALDLISDLSTSERVSLLYRFKDAGMGFAVHSYTDGSMSLAETESIGGYDCLVSENPDNGRIQVNFVYDNMLYTISCVDYDELVRIVENLRFLAYR